MPDTHGNHHIDDIWFQSDCILPRQDFLTPGIVRTAHNSGMRVIPWTLNTRVELKKVIKKGVDGFVTDNPCSALQTMRATGL